MTLEAGTRLGAYEILGLIGAGGMGQVYRARDTRLQRTVAIKILPHEWREDANRLRRFEQEARAAGTLNHPNILAVHDVGADQGQPFVVTELLDGETMRSRMDTGPLPLRKALEYARQIALGLAAAHEGGIVHRDLKPENIFVTKDGRVKVLDFGLAKLAIEPGMASATETASILQTAPGVVMGTAAYMAPEQARGLTADPRSDIFSFGAVLYEMLGGRRAFPGNSAVDVLSAIISRDPAPLDREGVPPAIEKIVRRSLEKNPDERFQSARDLAFALEAVENLGSGGSSGAVRASGAVRRQRFGGAAGMAAIAAGVAAGILIDRLALTRSPDDAAPRFSRVFRFTSTPAREFAPAISPDGKWVAYLSDARGVVDVWVKFIAGGEASNLTAESGLELQGRVLASGMHISPDGTSVAALARPAGSTDPFTVWLIPAPLPGAPRKLLDATSGVRWSPDGARLAIVRAGSARGDALVVAAADGSNGRELVPQQAGVHMHWPAWSSNGRYLYYQRASDPYSSEPSEIFRAPVDGGSPESIVRTARRAVFAAPMPDGSGLIYAANPDSADLELWWRSEDGRHSQRLTTGVGEYAEPQVSADGRFVIATQYDLLQSLELLQLGRPQLSFRALTDGRTGDLDPSLAAQGDLLVFSSSRLGSRTLWVANPDGSRPRPLTTGSHLDERPVFSPDGKMIAFVSARGNEQGIWIVSRDGGPPRKLASATVITTLSWSPDSRQIVFSAAHENRPRLEVLTLADGTRRVLPTQGDATAPAWSPDGRLIAYLLDRGALEPRMPLLTLSFITPDGSPRELLKGDHDLVVNFNNGYMAWAPDSRRLALVELVGSAPAAIWLFDPGATPLFRKLIELPPGPRLRGLTWTPDGTSIIVGKHDALSDIVLFERSR
jgi:Tol biopolymer transport system component